MREINNDITGSKINDELIRNRRFKFKDNIRLIETEYGIKVK